MTSSAVLAIAGDITPKIVIADEPGSPQTELPVGGVGELKKLNPGPIGLAISRETSRNPQEQVSKSTRRFSLLEFFG